MALTITEDWIRRRVKLKHENLDDVRSLSLPGTYHEKIGVLGESLRSFTRLKTLDLSRNALESIAGIENAHLMEKLNLYYNNISSLQDLHRLKENPRLQELDLRLNPVARNEPDYRLFLIHMLPNLRRLDDRSVRDGERKAALMHFTSDQAAQLTHHAQPTQPTQQQQQPAREKNNPRVELVRSLAKPNPVAAFDEDDVAVLDLVSRQSNDLNQPRPITGSQQKTSHAQDYTSHERRKMNLAGEGLEWPLPAEEMVSSRQPTHQNNHPSKDADPLLAKYPNLVPAIVMTPASDGTHPQTRKSVQTDDPDEYTSYKAEGHFTPHPNQEIQTFNKSEIEKEAGKVSQNYEEEFREHSASASGVEFYDPRELAEEVAPPPKKVEAPPPPSQKDVIDGGGEFSECIQAISSLVDKYWNGHQSLLKNQRFNAQMCALLSEVRSDSGISLPRNASNERDLNRLQNDLRSAREENSQLREKLLMTAGETPEGFENMDEGKSKSALIRAQRDLGILKGRLQRSLDENKELQENLAQLENRNQQMFNSGQCMGSDELQQENSRLKHELKTLDIRLRQASQMQEFAVMLQESHKSLVQTNEHLLRDLDETRRRLHENPRNATSAYKQTFNGS